ncbi:MAG: TIGR03435 family protein [Terracidiphilus sp.]|jgi:uncharacterized protein (TIGR03435 family)
MRCPSTLSLILIASLGACCTGTSQQPAPAQPAYDVATVKVNNGFSRDTSVDMDETTFRAINVPLQHLLVNAYGIRPGLMFGLPPWASSLRFDIYAKVTDPDLKTLRSLSQAQRREMIAAILVDRFHLKVHTETKILPVYELVVAKGGPKLTPSLRPDPLGIGKMDVHNSDIIAAQLTLSQLAGNLSAPLDRTVIDKTGLTGQYDLRLHWTPNTAAGGDEPADAPPDLFTAIQEQLGLKLQPAKGPVETLVIDHLDKPTAN